MQNNTFTVADYLLTRLKQLDVTEVFQIPGDYVKNFTQALEKFDGIETIGTSNELDASYAADAYGRTRGLSAVSLQYGVSTFSALNAVAGAYVESSPMIVISATPGSNDRQIGNMYNVLYHHSTGNLKADQEIYNHVTVASETLSTSVGADKKIDKVITAAITHKKPVYIAAYSEVWGEPCKPPSKKKLQPKIKKSKKSALNNAVDQAWSQIKAAKQPMIFAGVEVLRHGLSDLLQKIIDASGFVYTTTSLGKTVLDEEGDKFIGTYSDAASIPNVTSYVKDSDCFLSLGTLITDDYLWFVENKFSDMILATTTEMRVGYFTYKDVTMKDFMEALLERFEKSKSYPLKNKAPKQPKYPEPWASSSDPKYNSTPEILTYNRFFQYAVKHIEDKNLWNDINLTFGVSSAMYVATNIYGMKQNSFISSAAWQCIGYETGAALGAQLGSKRQSWTIAGDGGFMMICQSLSTLAKYNVNSVIFVMSNQVYAIEQVFVDIDAFCPKGSFDEFDNLPKWDYMALAKAYGANGHRASTIEQLNDVLETITSQKTNKPTLVEVIIPEKDLAGQMKNLTSQVMNCNH
ncbi:indolepyruvate decarboxylase [Tenacibaculum sp. MAR_2009_124]|uniref:alpha-keto acid decarboxylase family protein n=1 Tax=Tenacibaculum sp. MAR_2009_124 TaxID=1250059 RepID=UPI00089CE145|nr:thiamine pyrophosphate-dependent enzyme [Tenacibaculum sp. MAR_2009_124]SEB46452.1 indolepyruvate decarboxylase [Tenacibaculum sp. MAR_2009_124]